MPPAVKPPHPGEFPMNSLFCNLLPCDISKDQYLKIFRIWVQHLSKQARDEAKMYDEILSVITDNPA